MREGEIEEEGAGGEQRMWKEGKQERGKVKEKWACGEEGRRRRREGEYGGDENREGGE